MKTPTSRVDKLLGSMGYGSRTEMARLGKAGGIVLDGVELTDVICRHACGSPACRSIRRRASS